MKLGRVSAGLTAASLVVGVAGWQLRSTPPGEPPDVVERAPPAGERHPSDRLRRYPPGRVRLPADTPVLGVSVGTDHPAYVLQTFEEVGDHVAADVVGGRPIRVTYCDRRGCGRVFAGEGYGDLRAAGYSPVRGMLLQAGDRLYRQETGLADDGDRLGELPSVRTTWGEWSAAHPDAAVGCYPTRWHGAWMSIYPPWMTDLPDDAAVAGVSLGGHHRAYHLAGFDDPTNSVVRDFVGGVPVAVACCPETGRAWCVRAVDGTGEPMLTFAGWENRPGGGLLVDHDGDLYGVATGTAVGGDRPFPFPSVPVVRTTWGEWRAAHPDTSVYVGTRQQGVRLAATFFPAGPAWWVYLLPAGGFGLAVVLIGRRWLRAA